MTVLQELLGKMIADNEYAETVNEDSETLAESVDVEGSIEERDPSRIRGM